MTLVMVDLVGFVAFTAEHGDDLAHQACRRVTDAAAEVLAPVHGVVKSTGDGFIGTAGPALDPVPVLRQIAARSTTATGEPWPMRAAAHRGLELLPVRGVPQPVSIRRLALR